MFTSVVLVVVMAGILSMVVGTRIVLACVVLISIFLSLFIGTRVVEGSSRLGSRTVIRFLNWFQQTRVCNGANPKLMLCVLLGDLTTVVSVMDLQKLWDRIERKIGFILSLLILILIVALVVLDVIWFYYFCEKLAELVTYYRPILRGLDLTKKSRFLAWIFLFFVAMDLVDPEKYDDRLTYLSGRDRTRAWIRKIREERRQYESRRAANQLALRKSRKRYDRARLAH